MTKETKKPEKPAPIESGELQKQPEQATLPAWSEGFRPPGQS